MRVRKGHNKKTDLCRKENTIYKKGCGNKHEVANPALHWKICTAVGTQRRRRKTKPVREKKLGPAFGSAAYDVILYQSKQSAQQFLQM